jgi:hypothetical protein
MKFLGSPIISVVLIKNKYDTIQAVKKIISNWTCTENEKTRNNLNTKKVVRIGRH